MAGRADADFQLVLQLEADGADDLDAVAAIEEQLADALDDGSEVDDTDVSAGIAVISISTDDPDHALEQAVAVIDKQDDIALKVAATRSAAGGDFDVIWPEHYDGDFELP